MKYLFFIVALLFSIPVSADADKITIGHPANNIWSIWTKDISGRSLDPIDVVRIIDIEQNVVCYLVLDINYQPEIYCLRGQKLER